MSSRRVGGLAGAGPPAPRGSAPGGGKPAGQRATPPSAAPPAPPPSVMPSFASNPPASSSPGKQRHESAPGQEASGTIKASRPASRAATAATASASAGLNRAASPDFWSRSTAAQLVEASLKNPELKLQLLTRALEESRAKLQLLQRDRAALSDALLRLCLQAGAMGSGGGDAGAAASSGPATFDASAASPVPSSAGDEDTALPRRLDLLSTQLELLQESLRSKEAAVVEAEAAHERAALQVVSLRQQMEALEAHLEEARYTAQQHERAQHAMQVKLSLLEEQLAATADSARRRMEEQLDTFRGDALTARSLRTKFNELEDQLEAARRAQHAEAEQAHQLAATVERLQGRLREASARQADLSQQLWDKSAALNDLTAQHRIAQQDRSSLSAECAQLREALLASQQRAQRSEDLGVSLQAQCAAEQKAREVLAEEAAQLRADLQQEREQKHRLQSALAEEQLAGATQRAALQGKSDEVASLLLKLEEYSNRVVQAEGALEAASKQSEQAAAVHRASEEAARQARHENAALRDSVADLAATEARWRQQKDEAEARLAQAGAALEAAKERQQHLGGDLAASKDRVQRLLATIGDQSRQLEGMAALQREADGQKQQVADLTGKLHAATARAGAIQAALDEANAAKQQVEHELHKQQVLVQRLQEQGAKQAGELRAAQKEAQEARAQSEATAAQAAAEREQHAAAAAAQEQAHAQRKARNEQLEHDNRQQAIIIAELQAALTSIAARLAAAQQHSAALHRYGVAHGAAYGRLSAHAAGLHQQFARQLASLRQLCRHLGLHLEAALAAADPQAVAREASVASSSSAEAQPGEPAPAAATTSPALAAGVAAAVLSMESLRMEMQVAVQLLDMQAGSGEAAQLAGIAEALAADLAGLPADLLSSPRLEPSAASPGNSARGGPASMNARPSPGPALSAAAGQLSSQDGPQTSLPSPAAAAHPDVTPGKQAGPMGAPSVSSGPASSRRQPSSALSAQMAQMESHLQRLVCTNTEQAARVAAAVQLHEQERAARQRTQEAAAELSAQLEATQADLASTRGQRDQLDATSQRLARELRDAIYSLGQLCAQQQGQSVSRAVRGLTDAGVQTQHCELWEANLFGSGGGIAGSSTAVEGAAGAAAAPGGAAAAVGQAAVAGQTAAGGQAAPGRVLPLAALQAQIKAIYRAKAIHDLAVARGQKAFVALPDFVASFLSQQAGREGSAVQQRAMQLQASVEAYAGESYEVAMFGLSAGMLEEGGAAGAGSRGGTGSAPAAASSTSSSSSSSGGTLLAPATSAAAATVPSVLYHSRRRAGGAAAERLAEASGTVPALRRFCASDWHAAYHRSAARRALSEPFNPAAADHIHGMASEVHNLALSTPGVEQLMCWALAGGVADCLPQLDLGLPLAENQVPQLYLLAVESCRLLGLGTTPQLFVKSSSEAAALYLMLPASARLRGMNGGAATPASSSGPSRAGTASSAHSQGQSAGGGLAAQPSVIPASEASSQPDGQVLLQPGSLGAFEPAGAGPGTGMAAAAVAEAQEWQCALVLTSGLVDLLEPAELQAVLAGCLAFHAALTSPAALVPAAGAAREAAQLAVLCRSMAALGTLGALGALCPDALAARLPQQMAPFFHSRISPLLRRCLRYLAMYCDRVAASVVGSWRTVASAAVKQAAGCAVLRNELNLQAVLQQARELEEAGSGLLPKAVLREDGATLAAAAPSLALLRVLELQKWCGSGSGAGAGSEEPGEE